jgi:hypothetical protein
MLSMPWVVVSTALIACVSTAHAQRASSDPPKPSWTDSIKLSGFIQAQLVASEANNRRAGAPANQDRFEIRRGRLKLTYSQDPAEAVLHVDALPSGLRLLDAEVSGKLKWQGDAYTKLTAGLFRIPFGFEQQESMSVHPFPERSMFISRFFPGVRDVGARVWGAAWNEALIYQLAIQNGHPIGDATFPGLDANGFKDITARIGTKVGGVRAGISGLIGRGRLEATTDDAQTVEIDETREAVDYDRWALGADAVLALDVAPLGELMLVSELGYAQNLDRADAANLPTVELEDGELPDGSDGQVATGEVTDRRALGFYAGFQQHLGELFALGARYDMFNRDVDADADTLTAITLVGHVYPTSSFRLTAAYEFRIEEADVDNDFFWLRAQAKY